MAARSDDFNRTGSVNLHGSTPSDSGSAWVVESASSDIQTGTDGTSGRVVAFNIGGQKAAWLESSVTDHDVSADVVTDLTDVGVIARVEDANNYFLWRVAGSGNAAQLYKNVGGSFTLLDTGTTGVVTGDELKISCVGTTIKGYVNGVEEASVTESDLSTGTKVGIRIKGFVDDFASVDAGGGGGSNRRRRIITAAGR